MHCYLKQLVTMTLLLIFDLVLPFDRTRPNFIHCLHLTAQKIANLSHQILISELSENLPNFETLRFCSKAQASDPRASNKLGE